MIEVDPELTAFLRREYDRCQDSTLDEERETAIDRYNGALYGDEEDGRSQVVARDTAETTDYMVISILRTLVAGDRVVEFVHKDAKAAHIATETIMHLFMDDQDGYRILHDWLKAGLIEKNAVAMTYAEPQSKKRVESTLSADGLEMAKQQGHEVIEAEETGETHPEEGPMFRVAALQERPPKFCDAAVPNEEFYCSPDARTITEAALKGRKFRKPVSDLVQAGFDLEELEEAPGAGFDRQSTIANARDEDRNMNWQDRTGPNRVIWWHEEFVRYDADGDGIAELLYIQRTEDYKIYSIDRMDDIEDHPFEDWCPFPMQHRRVGQSLADKVMDIERVRTVLLRQSLDGIYLANSPRTYVNEDAIGETTIEDLLTVRPGALVRWKGSVQPAEIQTRFDAGTGFTMLEFMNGERESRTGITRLNQGLDADALNKTATGTALMQAQGQQVEEYLARNFANALARLFTKKARLLKRFGEPLTVPIDGEYIQVDPRQWPDDMLARPRVGLGSGRKEQRLLYRQQLAAIQAEAMTAGLGIVNEQVLFNSAKGLVSDMGLGDVGEFFVDPSKPQIGPDGQPIQKPEKPDPEMAKAQAEMQAQQQKMQMDAADQQHKQQLAAVQLQLQQAQAQATQQLEQQKAQAAAQLEQAKAQFQAELATQNANREYELAQQRLQQDHAHATAKMENDRQVAMHKNRDGGDLSK